MYSTPLAYRLLEASDVRGITHAAQPRGDCPQCQAIGQFVVHDPMVTSYRAFSNAEMYCVCRKCRYSIGLYELAASRDRDPAYLYKTGKISEIESISGAKFLRWDDQFRKVWAMAQRQHLEAMGEARSLQFRVGAEVCGDAWVARASDMIGLLQFKAVDAPAKWYRRVYGTHLVIPLYGAGGQILEFLFTAEGQLDDVVCRERWGSGVSGIAMIRQVLNSRHLFDNTAVVMTDPVMATRIQLRHLKEHPQPLPIAGVLPDMPVKCWDAMEGTKLVFWGPDIVDAIYHAYTLDADVSMLTISSNEMDINMRHHRPDQWVQRILRDRVHWRIALQTLCRRQTPIEIVTVLNRLNMPAIKFRQFLDACPPSLQEKMVEYDDHPMVLRACHVHRNYARETIDGWYNSHGSCIVGARIRLVRQLQYSDGTIHYEGYATVGDTRYTFTAPHSEVSTAGLFKWLNNYIQDRNGPALFYREKSNELSLDIALAISAPPVVRCSIVAGWDPTARKLELQSHSLLPGGRLVSKERRSMSGYVPAVALGAGVLPTEPIDAESWSIMQHWLCSILLPIADQASPGIAIYGAAASKAVARTNKTFQLIEDRDQSTRSRWPYSKPRHPPGAWCLKDQQHAVWRTTACAALVLSFSGSWRAICIDRAPQTLEQAAICGTRYILELAARNFGMPGDTHEAIVADLNDWATRNGITYATMTSENPAGRLLSTLVSYGSIRSGVIGFDDPAKCAITYDQEAGVVELNPDLIQHAVAENTNGLKLNIDAFLRELSAPLTGRVLLDSGTFNQLTSHREVTIEPQETTETAETATIRR